MSIYKRNKARLFELNLSGTVAQYNFQPRMPWYSTSTSGSFTIDESGNGFDLSGTTSKLAHGPIPGTYAAFFDGSTNYTKSYEAELDIYEDLTIEVIIKHDRIASSTENIVTFGGSGETPATNYIYSPRISVDNQVTWFQEHGSGVNVALTFNYYLPANQWVYLAFVRDDTAQTIKLYADGIEVDEQAYGTSTTSGATSGQLYIGSNDAGGELLNAYLAGLIIRNRAITPEEITSTWNRINPQNTNNLRVTDPLPEQLPSTHPYLRLWLQAGTHDSDDGDTVQTPTTLSTYGATQATTTERPYMITEGGEHAWKTWDDVSQAKWFDSTGTVNNIINTVPANYHAFVVFTLYGGYLDDSSLQNNHRILGADTWGLYVRRDTITGQYKLYGLHDDGTQKTAEHTISRYEPHLAEFWYDNGTNEMVLRVDDGSEARTSASNISSGTATVEIGGTTGKGFHGAINEVAIAYLRVSSPGIRNYFINKYGVDA